MTQEGFIEGLLAGSLGEPGESLEPIARTIFTLSLEHIPAGFGKVSTVVEYTLEYGSDLLTPYSLRCDWRYSR